MHRNHMIGCLVIAAIVALALFAFGAPAGVFAIVIACPLMMITMMFFMANAMRTHDHAPKR
jgi:predicted Na+-dependent transporter